MIMEVTAQKSFFITAGKTHDIIRKDSGVQQIKLKHEALSKKHYKKIGMWLQKLIKDTDIWWTSIF